jgi:hypothetical protein
MSRQVQNQSTFVLHFSQMTMKHILTLFILLQIPFPFCSAQKLFYAEPDREDSRNMNFEILGKYQQKYLIYKNNRNNHSVAIYDAEMQLKDKVPLDFIPDRVDEVLVFPMQESVVFIYQYQRKNTLYCMGARIDGEGNLIGQPIEIDTTEMNFFSGNSKVYSVITSDDKKKLMVFKMQNRYRDEFNFQTILLSQNLMPVRRTGFTYLLENSRETISDFYLDNDGNFLFVHVRQQSEKEYISKATLCVFPSDGDSVLQKPLELNQKYLDEIRIKVDNTNGRYLLLSFYSNSKRGSIDGLYLASVGKQMNDQAEGKYFEFDDEFRKIARGENNMRNAFNDYYLKHFIIRKDGGVLVTAESAYTSTRGNNLNRWDNPFLWGNGGMMGPGSYWGWNPYNPWGWGGGWGNTWGNPRGWGGGFPSNQSVRHYSDNVLIFSFDKTGSMQWNNMLAKSQFDDNTDNLLSYQIMNSGTELLLLYNEWMRRSPVLTAQSLDGAGTINRQKPLRSIDKGYDFMIRFARQVSSREMIVPANFRNSVGFVRIEF